MRAAVELTTRSAVASPRHGHGTPSLVRLVRLHRSFSL